MLTIRVFKKERWLEAWKDGESVFSTAVSLGFGAEDGHKLREGDGRTPEGRYSICTKNEHSKYYRSLGISYPCALDAKRAYERREITEHVNLAIAHAEKEGLRPAWDTPLGGFIMLHGEHPNGKSKDWTAGCIAISNAAMESLFAMASIGDVVEIYSEKEAGFMP